MNDERSLLLSVERSKSIKTKEGRRSDAEEYRKRIVTVKE